MTTHITTSDDLNNYELDKLIKKFSNSIKQQQQRNKLDADEFSYNQQKHNFKSNKNEFNSEEASSSLNNNNNNNTNNNTANLYLSYTPNSNQQQYNSSSSSSVAASTITTTNNNIKSQILKKNKSNFNLNSTIANISFNTLSKEDELNFKKNIDFSTYNQNNNLNDKAVFFTTLKSLFAIFDPECKGAIDLNELNQLGASKNEILNDVICYLYRKNLNKDSKIALEELVATTTKKANELNYNSASNTINNNLSSNNNSSSNCSSSSRSSSTNSITTNNNHNNNIIKPLYIDDSEKNLTNNTITTSSRLTFMKNNLKITTNNNNNNQTNRREFRSPSANQIHKQTKKLKQHSYQTNNPYYVSFDQFAQAAEIILDKRKLEKLKMYQQQHQQQQQNKRLNDLEHYSTIVTVQPPPPIIQSNRNYTTSTTTTTRPNSLSTTYITPTYTSLPIVNSNKTTHLNGATLSQAFENVTNFDSKQKSIMQQQQQQKQAELLKNANSCDINNLLDKEQLLLRQGLTDIELVKQFYSYQLKENKLKQQNVHKLKHQNLFSIDKMLTDLKQLNDFNSQMSAFLVTNQTSEQEVENIETDLSTTTTSSSSMSQKENFFMNQQLLADAAKAAAAAISTSPTSNQLPSYKEYLEQFDASKSEVDLDQYLKEKQSRIDSLQKEKSFLIRRLFEMKSEAASLAKTIPPLHLGNPNRVVNYEKLSPQQQQSQPIQHNQYQTQQLVQPQFITSMTSSSSSNSASSNDLIYRSLNKQI